MHGSRKQRPSAPSLPTPSAHLDSSCSYGGLGGELHTPHHRSPLNRWLHPAPNLFPQSDEDSQSHLSSPSRPFSAAAAFPAPLQLPTSRLATSLLISSCRDCQHQLSILVQHPSHSCILDRMNPDCKHPLVQHPSYNWKHLSKSSHWSGLHSLILLLRTAAALCLTPTPTSSYRPGPSTIHLPTLPLPHLSEVHTNSLSSDGARSAGPAQPGPVNAGVDLGSYRAAAATAAGLSPRRA